jgi:hypothetical protein
MDHLVDVSTPRSPSHDARGGTGLPLAHWSTHRDQAGLPLLTLRTTVTPPVQLPPFHHCFTWSSVRGLSIRGVSRDHLCVSQRLPRCSIHEQVVSVRAEWPSSRSAITRMRKEVPPPRGLSTLACLHFIVSSVSPHRRDGSLALEWS